MNFLLNNYQELTYDELIAINGGCTMNKETTIKEKIVQKLQDLGNKLFNNGGDGGNTSTTTPTTTNDTQGTGIPGTSTECDRSKVIGKTGNLSLVSTINTTSGECKGPSVIYHQQQFYDMYNFADDEKFGKNACGATSILNELSEQYTKETGKQLTDAQALDAMRKAVDAGVIAGNDAFVNDWGRAAQVMSDALGLKGKWTYTTNPKEATAIIISVDTYGDEEYDGYHDHFVTDIGNGQYYDPWTNKIGNIQQLHLTSKWEDDNAIKSPYRYIKYTA